MQISIRAAARFLTCLIAPLFSLWVHWDGLFTWFQADDFAYLGLHRDVFGWSSFWRVILTPSQQGTFRPWTDRASLILFWRWFGLDALPYHALVLVTHAASLLLLYWMILRLTRSHLAATLTPVLWTASAALADVIARSVYNEVLCALFLLAALACWMKFEETGKWRYYTLQTVIFILGFGALELNIIYPALAAAWAIARGRRRLALLTLPLFALSLAFYIVHLKITPPQTAGPYAMHFDASFFTTFWMYWKWTFVPIYWKFKPGFVPALAAAVILLQSAVLLFFVVDESRRRNFMPLFFAVWFAVTLAPLLPLRDHPSDYYLAIPTLGIAALISLLVTRYRPALVLVAVYVLAAIPATRAGEHFNLERGKTVKNLVLGVKKAIENHPGKAILLTDLSADLYGDAFVHRPFRVFTDAAVYLAPEILAQRGVIDRDWESVADFALPPGAALQALHDDRLEVYSAAESPLRNITELYGQVARNTLSANPPLHVNVGDALEGYLLGPGWYPIEGIYRWMSKRASVRIAGPPQANEKLALTGYCVEQVLRGGSVTLAVYIDGVKLDTVQRLTGVGSFQREFTLPAEVTGKQSINVEIEVSATFTDPAKTRELGLVFGNLEIR